MSYGRYQNNTTLWNGLFQSVVLFVPKRGTVRSKAWYCLFQSVVLFVPKRGIKKERIQIVAVKLSVFFLLYTLFFSEAFRTRW